MIDPRPTDIFQTGEVLNNTYEIQGVLGRGGTGEVYRVMNKVTGRIYAIKALNAQFSGNDDYLELMKREEEMRNIVHDSVVRYNICSRSDDGHVFLVMDYISGPSLADAMQDRQISPKELLVIAHRISQGLAAAHGQGIVHRDLSPDNIILRDGAADQATLIDFGIAKDTAEGARTIVGNDFAGKYEYAAPEQLDGKAEAKSDLYALGATLLAAYRGETPFLGTTPGEIVRRKQAVLETDGVPSPLKELIDTLTQPNPSDRPQDAKAAVRLIDDYLDPKGGDRRRRSDRDRTKKKKKSALPLIAGALALAVILAGGFLFRETIFGPSLDTVSPYTLNATKGVEGRTQMTGHAPDKEAAETLVTAFADASGAPSEAADVKLANGAPDEAWPQDVARLVSEMRPLLSWEVDVSNRTAVVTGLAADGAGRADMLSALQSWQATAGLSLDREILAGPKILSAEALAERLGSVQSCGALRLVGDAFELGAEIPITGFASSAAEVDNIRRALEPHIGSRTLDIDVDTLDPDLCMIRNILPPIATDDISIWLGDGADGSVNLTGVYTTGENPIADILVPSALAGGYLWVMVVDNTGVVFNVLPNVNDSEQRIERLGTIEGGLRRIPILHPVSILAEDPTKLALEINAGDYGRSEIVAILSRTPLFDLRRPRDESTAAVREALVETLAGREGEIIGISTRFIEARE